MFRKEHSEIPCFSLRRQNELLRQELSDCFLQVVDKGAFILDEQVASLERNLSHLCGVEHGVAVASGSDALYLALQACGIGKGDEVITTPFTFFATAGSISRVGAKPVFVDINPQTWNIDSKRIEEAITSKTKAIIPVHLYGCPANMDEIMKLAKWYKLRVIEDGAQAIGATLRGVKIGAWGDAACLSFFPTKNLGAFGDGGMVVTSSREIAEKVALLRVHGATAKYHHEQVGCNSRLDELQAALLNVKLKHLQGWTARRREIAKLYNSILTDCPELRLPFEPPETHHVYHQYTIATAKRNQLQNYLANCGIGTSIYYPVPLHLQTVYAHLGYTQGDLPVAESACHQALSLPMFPELTDLEVEKTAQAVSRFFAEKH